MKTIDATKLQQALDTIVNYLSICKPETNKKLIDKIALAFPETLEPRWEPKAGEVYFFVSSIGEVQSYSNTGSTDKEFIIAHNCFQTKAVAEIVAEKIKKVYLEG